MVRRGSGTLWREHDYLGRLAPFSEQLVVGNGRASGALPITNENGRSGAGAAQYLSFCMGFVGHMADDSFVGFKEAGDRLYPRLLSYGPDQFSNGA